MTKKAEAEKEREEAATYLRELFPPGTTVSTVLRHVSRSGMQRTISVVAIDKERGEVKDVSWAVARALNDRFDRDRGGVKVNGCGMDMGFHLIHNLSYALYRDGYACLGKGKCPSAYHNNHRDTIRCDGYDGRFCWTPAAYSTRFPVPEGWPTRDHVIAVDGDDGKPISYTQKKLLACLSNRDDEDAPREVCPTCKGEGYLPNPEGPERFDLIHKDGYALKHRWV